MDTETLIVNKISAVGSLTTNESWTETYLTVILIGFSESNGGDTDLTYKVWRDEVDKGASDTVNLGVGTYDYVLNTTGGANYSSTASIDTETLTVNKGTLTGSQASSHAGGFTYTYDNTDTTISLSESNTGDGDVTYIIYRDEIAKATGETIDLAAGTYDYVLNSTGGANWSTIASINSDTLTINKATPTGSLTTNETWTEEYPTTILIGLSESNSVDSDVTYVVYRDEVSKATGEVINLVVGTYDYVLNTTGGVNWSASVSMDTETLTIEDTTAPVLILDNPKAQQYNYKDDLYLNYTITDNVIGGESCWYKVINSTSDLIIDNVTLASCVNETFNVPREDDYTLTLYANDTEGNNVTVSVSFGITLSPPAIVMDYPADNAFFNSGTNIYFNITATDTSGVDYCQIYSNFTGSWLLNQSFIGVISGTQNGTIRNLLENRYKWTAWCNDTTGNGGWALNNKSLTVDLSNPTSTINQPGNATNMSDNTPDINITLVDNVGASISYTVYLNNVVNKTGVVVNATATNITLEPLPDNLYEIKIEATDNASNAVNSSALYLTIDTISPYANVTSPTNMSYNTTTIWFNATSNTSIGDVIKLNYNGSNVTIDINTSLTVEVGNHHLLLYTNDSAGNFGLNDSVYFSVDLTPPQISIIHPAGGDVTSGSMVVQLLINEIASICNYSVSGGVNSSISTTDNLTFLEVVSTPGDGIHTMVFYCADTAYNLNTTNITFLVRKWVGGGGGSGGASTIAVIVVSPNVTWVMTTEQDTALYEFQLVPGTTRTKSLLFESLGNEIRPITLSCEGELCTYMSFETLSFDLPVERDIRTSVEFTLDIPNEIEKGKYDANIIATDDLDEFSIVTVKGDIGTSNFIFLIFSKLFTSKEIFGIKIPYFVIFFFTVSLIGFGSFFLILKPTKISGGGGISGIVGIVSGFIILVFI